MTTPPPQPRTTPGSAAHAVAHAVEPWRRFAEWAAERLGGVLDDSADRFCVRLPQDATDPPAERGKWSLSRLGRRSSAGQATEPAPTADEIVAESAEALIDQLLARIAQLPQRPVLTPAGQPGAAHEIADRLFDAYQVEEGKVHLAGCRLEASPLVRWSRRGVQEGQVVVEHQFFTPGGQTIGADEITLLALSEPMDDATATCRQPGAEAPASITSAAKASTASAATPTATVEAKRAVGRLRASIGAAQLDIPFDAWATRLEAPPAVCPETGRESFHLVGLDDDRIVAFESTGVCEESGERRMLADLSRCAVTGRLLRAELCEECPATGSPVEKTATAVCSKCGQRVGNHALSPAGCRGCDPTEPAASDKPPVAELIARHPGLARWKRWKTAEMRRVRVFEASTLWRRLIVVTDRESGSIVHAAHRSRLQKNWTELPIDQR